ncbi:MAG TPA: UDP-N-acetylmuramoyl-L-alanine--D-glutamate ligase, partial [Alphaproteobacteria bacterium]|nr:UDP-N-acetylmuramoyl-L-alanine--D-glutamate ligase [Alphaproteobacteria bacterium]
MIALDHLKGRRVAVFGLGRTGLSAARALASGGARPLLWDDDSERRTSAEREG